MADGVTLLDILSDDTSFETLTNGTVLELLQDSTSSSILKDPTAKTTLTNPNSKAVLQSKVLEEILTGTTQTESGPPQSIAPFNGKIWSNTDAGRVARILNSDSFAESITNDAIYDAAYKVVTTREFKQFLMDLQALGSEKAGEFISIIGNENFKQLCTAETCSTVKGILTNANSVGALNNVGAAEVLKDAVGSEALKEPAIQNLLKSQDAVNFLKAKNVSSLLACN